MPLDRTVFDYHERTKHDFHRFAASLGYLDWATQPNPFREFVGTPRARLPYRGEGPTVTFDDVLRRGRAPPAPLTPANLGDFLRHSLGLSAWKRHGPSRWSLRVNPSSGNLHPTEGHVVLGPIAGLATEPGVHHYLPETHALEQRAALDAETWRRLMDGTPDGAFLAGLTSVTWREAWKYGERAFRYCLHDAGHALAALSVSAALLGWKVTLLERWGSADVSVALGLDRDEDFRPDGEGDVSDAEREEPELLALVHPEGALPERMPAPDREVLEGFRSARWQGIANRLSESHAAHWPIIDEVASSTRSEPGDPRLFDERADTTQVREPSPPRAVDARRIILQRRSCLSLDGRSWVETADFARMLAACLPGAHAPHDAIPWRARLHLALFVHRVRGVEPGLYFLVRDETALPRLREATRRDFAWTKVASLPASLPLYMLAEGDCRTLAARVSCDQEIAADGYFSLGMIADFSASLEDRGPGFYRNLFWESGVIGQVLYLEAEAAGARGTGIGCFFDDRVHAVLGIADNAWQSLYHFTVGVPVDDPRLETAPAYADEAG